MVVLLLALGLACLLPGTPALMFQSTRVHGQWDTWAFAANGSFFLYFLDVEDGSPGDGFGLATSSDGATGWQDHGKVWSSPGPGWEGTGAVWRSRDFNRTGTYLVNFSQCPGKYQNISFAQSTDLVHWERVEPTTWFNIDTRYYRDPGRWDCMYPLPKAVGSAGVDPPLYGFWTATPGPGSPPGSVFGAGESDDGIHWTALPSPAIEWGSVTPFGGELGAVEYLGGKYVALVGHGMSMWAFRSSSPLGPYAPQPRNFEVLVGGASYFARFFRVNGSVLVTHQAYSHHYRTYVAPFKLASMDADGALRLRWWPGNKALLGANLSTAVGADGFLTAACNTSRGASLEAAIALPPPQASQPAEWPGLLVEMGSGLCVAVLLDPAGNLTVGLQNANGSGWQEVSRVSRDMALPPSTSTVRVRVLARRSMVETYLNGAFYHSYLAPDAFTGRLGLYRGQGSAALALNTLNLPGTAVDLCVGKPTTCSSFYQSDPTYAAGRGTDGSLLTRWSSGLPYDNTTQWLAVDLEAPHTITRAVLVWELAFARGFALQVSSSLAGADPGANWTTFHTETNGKGGTEAIEGLHAVGRHFRILCTERGSAFGFSLFELQLFA